jgi:hypothetical protein
MAPDGRMRRRGNMEMSTRDRLRSIRDKDKNRLLHDQVILYGPAPRFLSRHLTFSRKVLDRYSILRP